MSRLRERDYFKKKEKYHSNKTFRQEKIEQSLKYNNSERGKEMHEKRRGDPVRRK